MTITTREARNASMREGASRATEYVQQRQAIQQAIEASGETPIYAPQTAPLPESEGGLRYGERYGEHPYGAG